MEKLENMIYIASEVCDGDCWCGEPRLSEKDALQDGVAYILHLTDKELSRVHSASVNGYQVSPEEGETLIEAYNRMIPDDDLSPDDYKTSLRFFRQHPTVEYEYYRDLEAAALHIGRDKDLEALGEWFERFGSPFWNGECYKIDSTHDLYPIMEPDDEDEPDGDYHITGWEVV